MRTVTILSRGHRLRHREPTAQVDKISGQFEVRRDQSLAEVERAYILHVLERAEGSQRRASEILGINPSTLWRKLKRYQGKQG